MLGRVGEKFSSIVCFRYAVSSAVNRCTQWGGVQSTGYQRATCANTADLRFRPDVDWWAGGASDGSETWRELEQHSRAPVKLTSGIPSEKVTGKRGRSSRLFHNPFQGIREIPTCLDVMLENRFDAGLMTRVVGVHTLQKAALGRRHRNYQVSNENIDLVCRWLSPLQEPEPTKPATHANERMDQISEQTLSKSAVARSRESAVLQLRQRGAVMLLYSLAKLQQVRGWRPLIEKESIQSLIQLIVRRLAQLTTSLDAQLESREVNVHGCDGNVLLSPQEFTMTHTDLCTMGVSNSLYALALLQCRADRLIASLTVAADGAAAQMDAQQLSNTLWALARLDVALPDTLLTLTRELADRQANSQDMGNAIWALAHLNCTSAEQLQGSVGKLAVRMLRPLPPVPDERVSRGHLTSFEPRHHIHVLWGLSTLGLHSTPLYDSSLALLTPQMGDVGDRGLAMLASVFGGGSGNARNHCRLALPLLCAIGDCAKRRVLKGSIVPDALAQCIWNLWLAAKAPAGCKQALLPSDRTLSAKRLLAVASSYKPILIEPEDASVGSVIASQDVLMLPGHTEDMEHALSVHSETQAVTATPQALLDCVGRLVSALGTTRPEVADRLLRSMQPRQKLQVLAVATDKQLLLQEGDIRTLLERMASPLQSALTKMNPSEVDALCETMSKSARHGAPLSRDLATSVVAHLLSGGSGVVPARRRELLRKLERQYKLTVIVPQSMGRGATVGSRVKGMNSFRKRGLYNRLR